MIEIKELDKNNTQYINRCDDYFTISSICSITFKNGKFDLEEKPVDPYRKKYESTKIDIEDFLKDPNKTILFGFYNNQIAGQVILEKHWNNYVWLEIAILEEYRRKGLGRKLIESSIDWSKSKGFPGIMLETQNNNVPACKFYKACGFKLGGIDTELYKGINKDNTEIALFWYYQF